ncbi:MAG: hypothetical protein ACRD2L_06985 [Terriglobia bacterium]
MLIETNVLTSKYGWSEASGRYFSLSTGRFVPFSEVRDALDVVTESSGTRMNALTQSLVNEQISLAEWQAGMMEEIKIAHTAAAASARGGWAQMSQSDWGAAGRLIRAQYDYLRNFASEIASGKQLLNGTALFRANLYAQAPRGTFEEMRRRYERLMNGMEEERRVLGEADHCNGCIDQAALGWQPIGTLEPIGSQECVTNCHCKFIFRKRGPNGWIVSET